MIVAFGTSTPTSITVVATSTSSSPRLERAPSARAARPACSRPCRQPDAVAAPARRAAAAPPRPRPRAPARVSDSSISGQTTYACRPVVEVRAQPLVRLGRALGARPTRSRSACGSPAASRSRTRPGRRRRSARACAGSASPSCAGRAASGRSASACRCSTPKRCCSSTTATARSARSTPSWISACVPTAIAPRRSATRRRALRPAAGQQRARHAELAAERLDREEVLLGERLRRRHQRALPARLDRAQERVERDDRLPGADVALEQPLHRHASGRGRASISRDRLLLVLGELERQRGAVARDSSPGLAERRRDRLARPRAARRASPSWSSEQLVEREPAPRPLRLLERRAAGAAPRARPSAAAAARLRAAPRAAGRARALRRARSSTSSRSRFGVSSSVRRVDRREVGGRRRRRRGRTTRTWNSSRLQLAAQPDAPCPARSLLLEPGLVEPDAR